MLSDGLWLARRIVFAQDNYHCTACKGPFGDAASGLQSTCRPNWAARSAAPAFHRGHPTSKNLQKHPSLIRPTSLRCAPYAPHAPPFTLRLGLVHPPSPSARLPHSKLPKSDRIIGTSPWSRATLHSPFLVLTTFDSPIAVASQAYQFPAPGPLCSSMN